MRGSGSWLHPCSCIALHAPFWKPTLRTAALGSRQSTHSFVPDSLLSHSSLFPVPFHPALNPGLYLFAFTPSHHCCHHSSVSLYPLLTDPAVSILHGHMKPGSYSWGFQNAAMLWVTGEAKSRILKAENSSFGSNCTTAFSWYWKDLYDFGIILPKVRNGPHTFFFPGVFMKHDETTLIGISGWMVAQFGIWDGRTGTVILCMDSTSERTAAVWNDISYFCSILLLLTKKNKTKHCIDNVLKGIYCK